MARNDGSEARSDAKAVWSVVVVYEDAAAREQAVDFCDQLVKRFWARFEFDVCWWSFGLLQGQPAAMEAAERAARADLVILSSMREDDFPDTVKDWVEGWLSRRSDREGILAGLVGGEASATSQSVSKHLYLRQVAHRGAMDYLTQVPQNIWRSIPESPDTYNARAAHVSGVLSEILHQQPPVPAVS